MGKRMTATNYETRKNIKKKKMIVSMLMKIKNILMRA